LAGVEFLTNNGRDNIWVPVAVVYWLDIGRFISEDIFWYAFTLILLALLALRYKWLTRDGLLAAFITGMLLLFSPEPRAIIPALVFFGVGSLISKLPGGKAQQTTSRRTAVQVFSNGLAPTLSIALYFVSSNEIWLYAGIAGFATALSDTISSEIGIRYGGKAIDVFSFKKVPDGLSGGITLIGTVAGLVASFLLVGVSSIIWLKFSWFELSLIGLIGFAGNIADSILGSTLQVKYFNNVLKIWEETPKIKSELRKGVVWIDNNRVNFFATLTSCILTLLVFALGA